MYDRAISSAPYRKLINKLFSDGVLPNPSTNLQVTAGTDMQVNLLTGFAICNGCQKLQETDTTLKVPQASSVYDRIDTVVLRLNDNDDVRECDFYVISGEPTVSPVRPALTRTDSIWELGLADILVKANSTQVSNANITDTRYEAARCGIISSISQFDTTTLYLQIQTDLKEFKEVNQKEFVTWFDSIKNQLEGDVAANLQKQIGALANLKTTDKSDLVSAINELAEKKIDVLDTMEEVEANTDPGKVAGALALKEVIGSLKSLKELVITAFPYGFPLVPTLSANDGNIIASVSSQYAYAVFDNGSATEWPVQGTNAWIGYKFETAKVVKKVEYHPYIYGSEGYNSTIYIQGSDDGTNWNTVHSFANPKTQVLTSVTFNNETAYKYWRFSTTALAYNNKVYYTRLYSLQFYGF